MNLLGIHTGAGLSTSSNNPVFNVSSKRTRHTKSDKKIPSDITVSILIRAKNEEKYIGKVLDAVFNQTYKNIEVIVVDSGSTDKTLEIARKYPVNIYEIKPEDFTWGYSLNYGFLRAKGAY